MIAPMRATVGDRFRAVGNGVGPGFRIGRDGQGPSFLSYPAFHGCRLLARAESAALPDQDQPDEERDHTDEENPEEEPPHGSTILPWPQ